MNKERIISLLEEQLLFTRAQNAQLLEQNNKLSEQTQSQALQLALQSKQLVAQSEHISLLTGRVEELTKSIHSLEQVFSVQECFFGKSKKYERCVKQTYKSEV